MLCPCKVTGKSHCVSQAERTQDAFSQQEVMSVEDESTSCYCLLDPLHVTCSLDSFGTYALTGEPITDCAVKQLKWSFGCLSCNSLDYSLRSTVWTTTPLGILGQPFSSSSCGVQEQFPKDRCEQRIWLQRAILDNEPTSLAQWGYPSRNRNCVTVCPLVCWRYNEVLGTPRKEEG